MPRRFNYTGRQKIRRADAAIRIVGSGPSLGFDAVLNLGTYKIDPQARVAVEAYRSRTASYKRFEYGYANNPVAPAERSLAEFHDEQGILFRVKVTMEEGGLGKLLAEADGIRPVESTGDGSTRPLLPVVCHPLDGEAWKIDFGTGSAAPMLAIDSGIPLRHQYATDPTFRAIAMPAIFRQILTRILTQEELDEEPDPEDWRSQWLEFGRRAAGTNHPEDLNDDQAVDDWIDSAVSAFARSHRFVDAIAAPTPA